jgi:hypothetical protein
MEGTGSVVLKPPPAVASEESLMAQLRRKYPGLARRADTGSCRAAQRLKCYECMGGSRSDVTGCRNYECPVWPYRHGRGVEKRPG